MLKSEKQKWLDNQEKREKQYFDMYSGPFHTNADLETRLYELEAFQEHHYRELNQGRSHCYMTNIETKIKVIKEVLNGRASNSIEENTPSE